MKVLIVEDNSDMRDLLSLVLERLYYVPVLARNGKDCLEKAMAEKPQLILMDIMMPVMDGWEAARALRANPETKEIPILATTALFRSHDLKPAWKRAATTTSSNRLAVSISRPKFENC